MVGREELSGRIAAVTGGGSGLGAAMAGELAGAGMAVALLDIDGDRAAEVAADLAATFGVATTSFRTDVGDPVSVEAAATHVASSLGGCDLVCANVGVQQFGAIDRLTEDDWTWVLNVNVMGTVRTVRAFLPLLRDRTGWRHIVVTSSSGALVPAPRLAAYQASKLAVMGFGETLRQELAGEGIGVSIVFPAGMMTRHLESSVEARPAELGESVTMPDDIEAMLSARGMDMGDVATAEQAVAHLIDDICANEEYVLTHGTYRGAYEQRSAGLEDAFDRLEARNAARRNGEEEQR